MKIFFYRGLAILWFIISVILLINYILISGLIYLITGNTYIDKVDNFLCNILDKINNKKYYN
jgi:hypothetical protein